MTDLLWFCIKNIQKLFLIQIGGLDQYYLLVAFYNVREIMYYNIQALKY